MKDIITITVLSLISVTAISAGVLGIAYSVDNGSLAQATYEAANNYDTSMRQIITEAAKR